MRRGSDITEAGLKDVATRIVHNVRDWELARRLMKKVKRYWDTKNERDDLSLDESRLIYRPEDYGAVLPLTKKRRVDIGWSDHAEYRSDLRDVEHKKVNQGITKWLRDRLREKGPDRKKVRMKLPGEGTAVVDYDLTRNPADAEVITVWAKGQTAATKMERGVNVSWVSWDSTVEALEQYNKMSKAFWQAQKRRDFELMDYRLHDAYGDAWTLHHHGPRPRDVPENRVLGRLLSKIQSAYGYDVREAVEQQDAVPMVKFMRILDRAVKPFQQILRTGSQASSSRTAMNLGPATLAALVDRMESRVRVSAEDEQVAFQKNRMPTDRNLGTRVHPDKKKFRKTKRQKDKHDLRKYTGAAISLRVDKSEKLDDENQEQIRKDLADRMVRFGRQYARALKHNDFRKGTSVFIEVDEPQVNDYIDEFEVVGTIIMRLRNRVFGDDVTITLSFYGGKNTEYNTRIVSGHLRTILNEDKLPATAEIGNLDRYLGEPWASAFVNSKDEAENGLLDEVAEFVKRDRTWFEEADRGRNNVIFNSREYGETGSETPGQKDLAEAKALIRRLKAKFGDRAKVTGQVVDEFVDVTVTVK